MSKKVGLFLCPKGGGYANGIQNATLAKIDEAGEKLQNIGSSVENVGKKFLPVTAAASSNANTNVSMMGETFKYCAPIAGALGFSAEDTAEAIGLMANSGIKASQAGTSLRTIIIRRRIRKEGVRNGHRHLSGSGIVADGESDPGDGSGQAV